MGVYSCSHVTSMLTFTPKLGGCLYAVSRNAPQLVRNVDVILSR
jgi:hypothetical protein